MEGPEPSWIAKKREQTGKGIEGKVEDLVDHEENCGCGGH